MRLLSRWAYLALLLGDLGVLYLSVFVMLSLRYLSFPDSQILFLHLYAFSILSIFWFLVYFASGLYGRYTVLFRHSLPITIFIAQIINILIAVIFFFLYPIITPKSTLLIYLFVSLILMYVWRILIFPYIDIRKESGAILIGTSYELSALAEEINTDPVYPLEFRAIIHPELMSSGEIKDTVLTTLKKEDIQALVIDVSNKAIDDILPFLYDLSFVKKKVIFIDARKLYEEVFEKVPFSLIDDRWILRYMHLFKLKWYSLFKLLFDYFTGIILGILCIFLCPILIVLIKLQDYKKPAFYVSRRVGYKGKEIKLFKLRTMNGLDSGKSALSSKLKPTKIGSFLRKTRLDELPQFINLLKGELSFVGPRPEIPELAKEYKEQLRYYNLRHSVKPGLSGWAQIKHSKHPHHKLDIDQTKEKLAYDLYYIQKRGFWFDLYITILTLKIIFTGKGS